MDKTTLSLNKYVLYIILLFTSLEIVITAINYNLDVTGFNYRLFQYLFIVGCFIFALINIKRKKINFLVVIALMFTLCADYCLVLENPMKQSLGMTFFLCAQITYEIKLICETNGKKIKFSHLLASALGSVLIVIVTILVLKDKLDYLSVISVVYFFNLIVNIIFAFINFKKQNIFAIGLVFFLCCDVLVGLLNANGIYFTINSNFINSILYCDVDIYWISYRISQYLIALSTIKFKK